MTLRYLALGNTLLFTEWSKNNELKVYIVSVTKKNVSGLYKGDGTIGFLSVIDNRFWGWNGNLFFIFN